MRNHLPITTGRDPNSRYWILALALSLIGLSLALVNYNAVNHFVDASYVQANDIVQGVAVPGVDGEACMEQGKILLEECMQFHARKMARAWPYKLKESWCVPTNKRGTNSKIGDQWQGLLYVKVPKVSSSTLAGVALRINDHTGCEAQWEHRFAHVYQNRTKQTFLLGSSRDPAHRDLSHIQFFCFGETNFTNPTTEDFLSHGLYWKGHHSMRLEAGQGGYQYQWLSLDPIPGQLVWSAANRTAVIDPDRTHGRLKQLWADYDFFSVVERMDESLVALSILMGIDPQTTLAASAKVSGSYRRSARGKLKGQCLYGRHFEVPQEVYDHMASPSYLAMTYADQLIHRAAEISLDLTIQETIGTEVFEKTLKEYRLLKEQAIEYCGLRLSAGCYPNGTKILPVEPCYVADFGCGYKCLDEVVERKKEGLWG